MVRLFQLFFTVNFILTAYASRCLLKPQRGPCQATILKWFFDNTTNKCAVFSWGGCGGVVPFHTESQCLAAKCPEQDCVKAPNAGPCRADFPKWFFNKSSGACETFSYGGCAGFVPFDTEFQCISAGCNPSCAIRPATGPYRG